MADWKEYRLAPHKERKPQLKVKVMGLYAQLPRRKTDGSAGLDIASTSWVTLFPGDIREIHTGLAVEIPKGHYGHLVARSSLGKVGVRVAGGSSVIDEDYRGEILIYLINDGAYPYEVKVGDWVAQMVIQPYTACEVVEADTLSETKRGVNGFGSTGR